MKVARNTADILIVGEQPWLIAIFLGFGVLLFAGFGILTLAQGEWIGIFPLFGAAFMMIFVYVFVRRVQVVFHRPEGWVEIRQRSLRRYDRVRHELAEIDHAIVEGSHSGNGQGTFRIALVIPKGQSTGTHPLTSYYVSGTASKRVAKVINEWLKS